MSSKTISRDLEDMRYARYTLATINTGKSSVKGMIIFPDGQTIGTQDGIT
ncbi:MAG: hypothetical protein IJK92_08135 [Bacteroidales bacterium]|nr:hypothetical protein [Bacteroidales bacterium]